ncbi:tudor domain-containing protein 1 [Eleutherodactylus coqui]|uniref:tudor domain-containing protein 1 n=1 Tax=Eleutherodactylus coqui TaxID=57060 RepID=UPI003461FD8A
MEFQAYAVEFSSPSSFFVKALDAKSEDNLTKVTNSLKNLYSNSSSMKTAYTPEAGEVCVAKYQQDQQWYRALVYNVEANIKTAQVLYLDYGNTETVSLDNVQVMDKDLVLLPPCALHCSLAHVAAPPFGWSPECLVEVKGLLLGQKLLVRIIDVIQEELPRYAVAVTLLDSGVHVHEMVIEKGYSFPPLSQDHGKTEDPETVSRSIKPTEMPDLQPRDICQDHAAPKPEVLSSSLRVGDSFKTLITVIHNPEMFFCQQVQNAAQLSTVMVMMQERYGASPASPGFLPASGEICAAQFTEDDSWYRASMVRRVSDESVLVGYLDFGNTETLHVSRVRRIEPDLLSIPFQAAQCRLAGVKPPSGEWTSEATDKFKDLVTNKILTAAVMADCDRVLTVELIDESVTPNVSISQHLMEAGLAVPTTPDPGSPADETEEEAGQREDYIMQLRWTELPLGQQTEVLVCMLQDPGEFFCHVHKQTDLQLLNQLNVSLGQYCTQHKSAGYYPAREEICGAHYAGDGSWYRAQVKDFLPAGAARILFLDYGNAEDVALDRLCRIPSRFLELPFQAIRCSLSGIKPTGENWSEDSTKTFQKSVVGIKLLAKAIVRTKGNYSVELATAESGAVIADVLIAAKCAVRDEKLLKEKTDVTDHKPLRPPRDPSVAGKMLHISNNLDKVAPTYKELSRRGCNGSPRPLCPVKSIPSLLRGARSAVLKTSKEEQPGGRKFQSRKLVPFALNDMRYPKYIPSPARDPLSSALRSLHSGNSSALSPVEPNSPQSTSSFQRESCSTNPNSLRGNPFYRSSPMESGSSRAPASLSRDLHPSNLSPSSPKEMCQANSIPTAIKESRCANSISDPHGSLSGTPVESKEPSCSSPPAFQPASLVDPCKPSPHNSTPSTLREFQLSNSTPTARCESPSAEKGAHPDRSSSSNGSSYGERQNLTSKSVKKPSAAGQELPGVRAAQTWRSVDLPLNEAISARVLKVISPDLFYVFPKENRVDAKRLQQVMMEILAYCSAEADQCNYSPSVGDACCAKFTEDGQWYRAVVLELHGASAKVAYADYGNTEVLPFACLLPMKERFLELPVQLTSCSLADALPVTERWSPEATCTLTSVLLGADVLITAKSLHAGRYHVSVNKPQEGGVLRVAETLLTDGLARSGTPMTNGCPDGSGCCCRDLLKRVEKLEEIILRLLNPEELK